MVVVAVAGVIVGVHRPRGGAEVRQGRLGGDYSRGRGAVVETSPAVVEAGSAIAAGGETIIEVIQ